MTSFLSTSMAEEFVVCTKCHHPTDAQSMLYSTPRRTRNITSAGNSYSTPRRTRNITPQYASTPCAYRQCLDSGSDYESISCELSSSCYTDPSQRSSSCELLRDSDHQDIPQLDCSSSMNISMNDLQQSAGEDQLSLEQCSFLELPPKSVAMVTDLDLSEDFLSPCEMSAITELCETCSFLDQPRAHNTHRDAGDIQNGAGPRMALYFSDLSGHSPTRSPRRDSISSADSGLCDVDKLSSMQDKDYCPLSQSHISLIDDHSTISATQLISAPTSPDLIGDLTTGLEAHQTHLNQAQADTDAKFQTARDHLTSARDYYHTLVDQWYYKNMSALTQRQELVKRDQRQQEEETRKSLTEIRACVDDLENIQQHSGLLRFTELGSRLEQLHQHIQKLQTSVSALTQVSITVGRCQRLTSDELGGILIQRHLATEQVPRSLVPGRCLGTFDSRCGVTADYMATGLSLTSHGDLIVTDTGLDSVSVFSSSGELKLNINTIPGDYPTTAVQYQDMVAVACTDRVQLYDLVTGTTCNSQLPQSLSRPQGVATDASGHLVVSAQRVHIPAVGVYDRDNLLLQDLVIGDTICHQSTDQVLFTKPWYVAVDQSDNIIVSDRDSHTLRVMTRSGELVNSLGALGHRPGQLFQPAGLCVDPHGRIIVADSQNHRVQVLTPSETSAVSVVTQEHDGIECPMDVALDSRGRLYVLQGDGLVRIYQYC